MSIIAISRDWGADPSIVRMVSNDVLAVVTATGYLAAQKDNIEAINAGEFTWEPSDLILLYYSPDELDFFRRDAATDSLVIEAPPGSLTNVLASGLIYVGNSINIATPTLMTGDVTIDNTGITTIAAGAITNAKVNASAAIAYSKLAALASGNILVGSAGNVATSVAMSGDATIIASGALTIAAGAITNAKVNASAAIAFSKLATLATGHILAGNAGVVTDTTLSGDATIGATGVLTIANDAITTVKILNANVTLAKLASGITPSHIVKFAGQPTTTGGAASEAFTITGAAATDLAFVQVVDNGTNNVTVLQAVVTLNTLTITFSGDPSSNTVFNYQLLRAAS